MSSDVTFELNDPPFVTSPKFQLLSSRDVTIRVIEGEPQIDKKCLQKSNMIFLCELFEWFLD